VCQWAFAELSCIVVSWMGPTTSASRAVVHAAGFRIQPLPARKAWDGDDGPSDAWVADLLPEDAEPSGYRPLTAREHQVLTLMATGKSNQQISKSLGISENTAKNHVRAVLDALQAPSRTAAVVIALRAGLVGISFDDA
jgi:DNA-binding NarL/FixJ family response regulator